MLTRTNRLTSGESFSRAVRRGRRAGTGTLVLHLAVPAPDDAGSSAPARVGFVVSKAVGPAVARNLVRRRLRHLARERLPLLPCSAMLVVRALPPARAASYAALGGDFDSALARVVENDRTARQSVGQSV